MRIGSKHDENFAFLKDDEDMREWEANEKELDRQWYDADEDGQGRYGEMDDYYNTQTEQQTVEAEQPTQIKTRIM